jgi:5-methylcytosine-specific restriction endonuclease McrA
MSHSQLYLKLINCVKWRRLRNAYLTEHPLCERCKAHGYIVAAQCVHHVVPVETGRTDADCEALAYSWSNLQSLCFRCHSDIHAAERSHSTEGHRERAEQRLAQWVERNVKKTEGPF